jgi:hypothetical protein
MCLNCLSELEAVPQPEGVKPFVGVGQVGIRNMVEHDGDAVAPAERDAELDGYAEENA